MNDYTLMHTVSFNAPPDRFRCQHFRKAVRLPCLPPLGAEVVDLDEYIVDGVRVEAGSFEVKIRTCAESWDTLAQYVGECEAMIEHGWTPCDGDGAAIAPESNG